MERRTPPAGKWEKTRSARHDDSDPDDDLHLESGDTVIRHSHEDASESLLPDDPDLIPQPRTEHRIRMPTAFSPTLLLLATLFSALLGCLATLAITSRPAHNRPSHRNENTLASPSHEATKTAFLQTAPCGSTPSEARSAGCVFDLVSFNWLPPACHDGPLAADFEAELESAGMLLWYEDMERTRPLGREQVATGEHTGIYVSLGYHLRHCTAMWRRMHRAIMGGGGGLGRVDSYIWSYHHTRHCEEMLLTRYNESDLGEVFTTEVRIKYPDCGVVL